MNKRKLGSFRKILIEQQAILEKQYKDLEEGSLLASQSDFSGEMPFEDEFAASGTTISRESGTCPFLKTSRTY